MNPIPTERSIFFFWKKIAKMIARRAGNNKVRNEIRDSIKVESVANSSLTAKEEREELLVRSPVRWKSNTRETVD